MDEKALEGKYQKSFSQKSFSEKILYLIKSIGGTMVYPNVLLIHAFKTQTVTFKQKMAVIGAFAYFIFPIDLIPDFLLGFGYADDLVALAACLTALATCYTDEVQASAQASLRRLLGDYDDRAISAIATIIRTANRAVNLKNPLTKEESEKKVEDQKIEVVDVEEVKPIEAPKG